MTLHHNPRDFPEDREDPERVFAPFLSSFLTLHLSVPTQRCRGPKHPEEGQGKAPQEVAVFSGAT